MALADLARDLVAEETEVPRSEIDQERVRRCQTVLYHHHVPRLADSDLVEFDSDRRTVTLAE